MLHSTTFNIQKLAFEIQHLIMPSLHAFTNCGERPWRQLKRAEEVAFHTMVRDRQEIREVEFKR